MKRNYNLFTAITMLIGIIIGSGIFFKSDDVLRLSNNNMIVGIILFAVAAIAVIFGSLALSQLAMRTDKPGGLVTYAEDFVGMRFSCMVGWFQTFLYMPTIAAIVAWITGQYVCELFGWAPEDPVVAWMLVGICVLLFTLCINIISAKLGGLAQNLTTVIKLLPLVLLAVAGLVFGKPSAEFSASVVSLPSAMGIGILAAFGPLAFSFDGWVISTSICHEIKNSKRNLPLALTIAPLGILALYVLYFVGTTSYFGADRLVELGNAAPLVMANELIGPLGEKLVLVLITVAVVGTVNGLMLGMIRMPYALAKRNMMPFGNKAFSKLDKSTNMPLNSALFVFGLSLFWLGFHVFALKLKLNVDISEIAIGVSYALYIVLYIAVMRLYRKKEIKSIFSGIIVPIFAMAGSVIIISGSISSPMFPIYFAICAAVVALAGLFYSRHKSGILPPTDSDKEWQ